MAGPDKEKEGSGVKGTENLLFLLKKMLIP